MRLISLLLFILLLAIQYPLWLGKGGWLRVWDLNHQVEEQASRNQSLKLRNAKRFLEEGDKVKVTMRFRGREMSHLDIGRTLLNQMKEDLGPVSKVEYEPKLEGRQMIMILVPAKS